MIMPSAMVDSVDFAAEIAYLRAIEFVSDLMRREIAIRCFVVCDPIYHVCVAQVRCSWLAAALRSFVPNVLPGKAQIGPF